jgi:hypothetical protein
LKRQQQIVNKEEERERERIYIFEPSIFTVVYVYVNKERKD